jgi:putative transposase
MPNHVHLLIKPRKPDYDVGKFMYSVKKSVMRKALSYRKNSDKPDAEWARFYDDNDHEQEHFRFWQAGPGYDRNSWSVEEILEKLKYMHDNPVRSGLSATPEEWRWSSAAFYAGGEPGPVPIEIPDL